MLLKERSAGDIWVYGTNTISVLMHSYGRMDYYVRVCVCVCVYLREDDEWIRASSLNTSTVVFDWMLLLRWKGLGDFSRDEAQSINKWLLITPSLFHEPWPRDLQQLYRERQYVTAKPKIRQQVLPYCTVVTDKVQNTKYKIPVLSTKCVRTIVVEAKYKKRKKKTSFLFCWCTKLVLCDKNLTYFCRGNINVQNHTKDIYISEFSS